MSVDHVYWTFSAASQCISAFIAILLVGYTIVNGNLEAARKQDDTLEEVHAALLREHHKTLSALVWLTGFAILGSLLIVYFNRSGSEVSAWLQGLVALADVAAIVGGLAFVVSAVNPHRYARAAKKELKKEADTSQASAPTSAFFEAFVKLEQRLREYIARSDVVMSTLSGTRPNLSFRRMIETLRANESIDSSLYEDLLDVSRYRNLVFHGHVDRVDPVMVQKVDAAVARVSALE